MFFQMGKNTIDYIKLVVCKPLGWGIKVYKLVIVEDEDNIRQAMECYIPWQEMGFEVVSAFSDGLQAVEYIKNHPCDAVLTDILMNKMTGLQMIQRLSEIRPEIKVVILSGYSDFSYAQQAIQYRVVDYLLKPVDEEDLMRVFKGIKEQLDLEKTDQSLAELETQELKQMLQRSFFRNLLSGHVGSKSELLAFLRLLGIEEANIDCPLFAYEVKMMKAREEEAISEVGSDSLDKELKQVFSSFTDEFRYYLVEEKNDKWMVVVICLQQTEPENLRRSCNQKMQEFVHSLSQNMDCDFSCNLTHSVIKMSDLMNEVNAISNQDAPLLEADVKEALHEKVISDYRLLVIELDLGSRDTMVGILDSLVRELKDASLEDVKFILKNLYSMIEENYKKRKLSVVDITKGRFHYNNLYKEDSFEAIGNCVKEDFCILSEALMENQPEYDHGIIDRITEYLKENIGDELSHDAVAAKYRIHPGYMSRLFKQATGENFSEYIFRIKMEKAAELLKDGRYKVNEVARMIGYSGSSYFSIMYKRHTGYTPKEYQQRVVL